MSVTLQQAIAVNCGFSNTYNTAIKLYAKASMLSEHSLAKPSYYKDLAIDCVIYASRNAGEFNRLAGVR